MRFIDRVRSRWSNIMSALFTRLAARAMDISVNCMFNVIGIIAKSGRAMAKDGDYNASLEYSGAISDLCKLYKTVAEAWIDGHNETIADLDEAIVLAELASRLSARMADEEE